MPVLAALIEIQIPVEHFLLRKRGPPTLLQKSLRDIRIRPLATKRRTEASLCWWSVEIEADVLSKVVDLLIRIRIWMLGVGSSDGTGALRTSRRVRSWMKNVVYRPAYDWQPIWLALKDVSLGASPPRAPKIPLRRSG